MNIPPNIEQATTSQTSNALGNNVFTNAISPSLYDNDIDPSPFLGPDYLEFPSTPQQQSSSIYTGYQSLQHILSTPARDDLISENFQHNSTRDPQHANSNSLQPNISTNISNNNSVGLCIRSNYEIADKLFTLIRAKLIEGENISVEYKPSFLKDSIQFFYRTYASGPLETLEFGLSIRKSIRDVLLDIRIQDRDDKSSCILEVVDGAYYKEGWRLNKPTHSGQLSTDHDRHDAHISSAVQSIMSSPSFPNQFASSSQTTESTIFASSRSKRRPKERTATRTSNSQSKKQRRFPTKPYECYCGKLFPNLKALSRHFNTHSPCQFIACPEANCSHLSLRIDSMEDHLKIHHIDISRLRSDERHQTRQQLKQNTFSILDCTHNRCIVEGCNRQFPRHEIDGCRKSQAHILGHYKNKNSLPRSFRHICSDEEFCNGKEAWRKSMYVTGLRIQKLDQMDIDDLEEDL
ncbi:hypothetical protein OCU04_011770 [Sclerotinia nivalis]|nr:hypothetical protein OCU04_011770 [Sclerotinia nivalis]